MKIDVLTLFPNMFSSFTEESLLKKAIDKKILEIDLIDFRTFSTNKHHKVDDYPYGGGKGLVISPEPIIEAYNSLSLKENKRTIFLSPGGEKLTQGKVKELSSYEELVLICGHYEGVDERVIDLITDEEISIGDYVLTGGELPAMVLIDAVSRYIDGVVGSKESVLKDSLSDGLLKYPQYTYPRSFAGLEVPEVLLSGHHENIEKWRKEKSIKRTKNKRPDLWAEYLKRRENKMNIIDTITDEYLRTDLPEFKPGDTVKVHVKVVEGEKERIQVYEGVVIKRQSKSATETFTVRRVAYGVVVERTFPIHSPRIDKIEVIRRGRVRRAKLYYLKDRIGKAARIKDKK